MTTALVLLVLLGGLINGLILGARWGSRRSWVRSLEVYEVTFPRDVTPAQVIDFLAGASGLVGRRWQRPFVVRGLGWEVSATDKGITHQLLVTAAQAPTVLSALRAAVPGARTTPVERPESWLPSQAAELSHVGGRRVLAPGAAARVSAAVLSSLQPLSMGERIVLQWILSPTGPSRIPSVTPARSRSRSVIGHVVQQLTAGPQVDHADVADWRRKHATPVFVATGRIGATATTVKGARALRTHVLASFHTANAPGTHLFRAMIPNRFVAQAIAERTPPLVHFPAVLNAEELVGLLAIPLSGVVLPGVTVGGTKALAPVSDIPAYGRVVAHSTFPGVERPLALSVPDSLRHLHVIGPTGSGKSTLLLGLVTQDMQAGRGVIVVEPKGDLVADVLDRVPPERTGDVVLLDPADESPVGLNLLARPGDSPELVVDQVVSIFHDLFRDSWGPRTDDILRSALLTLVGVPGMTLAEVPLLLTDPNFRRPLVARINDPVALGPFWGWFDNLSDAERAQVIAPLINKLRTVLLRRQLRNVVGQASPRFDFDRALAERAIILVPLAKGLLGEDAAALLGSLVVTRLWQAVQGRVNLPAAERPATFAYIDEFQDYLRAEIGIEGMLTQARALGLSLTLAHQHLGQLSKSVREAVMANARSRVIFQVSAGDGAVLARELAPHLTGTDLQSLGRWEVVASLSAGNRVAPPATAVTTPAPPETGQAEAARLRSRATYGIPRHEVEAAIHARHTPSAPGSTSGRRSFY